MPFTRVGYSDVEYKRDLLTEHIGYDPGRVVEFAVLFEVNLNFPDLFSQDCPPKTLRQNPAKHCTAILR